MMVYLHVYRLCDLVYISAYLAVSVYVNIHKCILREVHVLGCKSAVALEDIVACLNVSKRTYINVIICMYGRHHTNIEGKWCICVDRPVV